MGKEDAWLGGYANRHFLDHLDEAEPKRRETILARLDRERFTASTQRRPTLPRVATGAAALEKPAMPAGGDDSAGAPPIGTRAKPWWSMAALVAIAAFAGVVWMGKQREKKSQARLEMTTTAPPASPQKSIGLPQLQSLHAPWGTPRAEFLVYRQIYLLGYHPRAKIARWVSYRVNYQKGADPLKPPTTSDPDLPAKVQLSKEDFQGSDYERGGLVCKQHLLGYKRFDPKELRYYSIIVPQTASLNQSLLNRLDNKVLKMASEHGMWVMTGPIFKNNIGFMNEFLIPSHYFYIICQGDGSRLQKVWALMLPNAPNLKPKKPEDFFTSVDAIEEAAGLDFFDELPQREQAALEAAVASGF